MTIDEVVALAQNNIREHHGQPPIVLAVGTQDRCVLAFEEFGGGVLSNPERMLLAGMHAARQGHLGDLTQLFFVSESWFTVARADTPLGRLPADAPDRREALLVASYQVAERQTAVYLYELRRNQQHAVTDLVPLPDFADASAWSPLLPIFVQGYTQAKAMRFH